MAEDDGSRLEERDSNDWEAFRRAVGESYTTSAPSDPTMTPSHYLEQFLSASATRRVLGRRESFQTAREAFDDDTTLVEGEGSLEASPAPRQLASNNPFRNHRNPTVEDVEDEALTRCIIRQPHCTQSRVENSEGDNSMAISKSGQQHRTQTERSSDTEQWLAAIRSALEDPVQGVNRIRQLAASWKEVDVETNLESDTIRSFIEKLPLPPNSSSNLRHQIGFALTAGVSRTGEGEDGSSPPVRPKSKARVNNLRPTAELPTLKFDSGTQLQGVNPSAMYPSPSCDSASSKPIFGTSARQEEEPLIDGKAQGNGKPDADDDNAKPRRISQHDYERAKSMSEPEYRRVYGSDKAGDVISPLSAPKAEQKPPRSSNISKPLLRVATDAPASTACAESLGHDERATVGPASRTRSSSLGTARKEADVANDRNHVDDLMRQRRPGLIPEQAPERPRPKVTMRRGQESARERSQLHKATVVAPVAVAPVATQQSWYATERFRRQQQATVESRNNRNTSINPAYSGSKATPPRYYARPDPFAPKPESIIRNMRPTDIHSLPRAAPSLTSRQIRPERTGTRQGPPPRLIQREPPPGANVPIWERLSQQQTSSSTAKDKRKAMHAKTGRSTDEDHDMHLRNTIRRSDLAMRAQAMNPRRGVLRVHSPEVEPQLRKDTQEDDEEVRLGNRPEKVERELSTRSQQRTVPFQGVRNVSRPSEDNQESRQDSGIGQTDLSIDQSEEQAKDIPEQPRRKPPAIPHGVPGQLSGMRYRPESVWSPSGIVFTSRNGRNGNRPDPTPKSVVPTAAEYQGMVRRAAADLAFRNALTEIDRQTIVAPTRARRDSRIKSSMKKAMTAMGKVPAKMNGMKDSAWAGIKEYAKQNRRHSLDSQMERPDIETLRQTSLIGQPYEDMERGSRPLGAPESIRSVEAPISDLGSMQAPAPDSKAASPVIDSHRRGIRNPFRVRLRRRTAHPLLPSTLTPHQEEEEPSDKALLPLPASAQSSRREVFEMLVADREGETQIASGDTIRVRNEGRPTGLHARDYIESAGVEPAGPLGP